MVVSQTIDPSNVVISEISSSSCLWNFRCGEKEIDGWAKKKALQHNSRDRARVFCAKLNGNANSIGFYCLSFAPIPNKYLSANDRDVYKITGAPFIYIDYLAVQQSSQRCGIGTLLLMNAIIRSYNVSKNVAIYGICLKSLNDETTKKYEKHGFVVKEDKPIPLMILPILTVRALIEGS